MTNLRQQFMYGVRAGHTVLSGYFTVNSDHSVTLGDFKGIKSVQKRGTGIYLLNFDTTYIALTGFSAGVEGTSADGYMVKLYDKTEVDGYHWNGSVKDANSTAVHDGYVQVLVVDDSSAAKDPQAHNVWVTLGLKTSVQG
jgi:hypothetical protein